MSHPLNDVCLDAYNGRPMTAGSSHESVVRLTLAKRLAEVNARIAAACARASRRSDSVKLVAVTKTAIAQQIREIVALGVCDLGENRAQVLQAHLDAAQGLSGIQWHMIGHLQRNKVKELLPHVAMIQSVDSLRLAQEIELQAQKIGKRLPILIEVNAGEEPQKFGATPADAIALAGDVASMPHLELQGIMSMAPLTDDLARIRSTFAKARGIFMRIRDAGAPGDCFRELSMGMSGDFEIAIEEGATIVRIGSLLFSQADA